jgi:predicted GIY-YIG superfamily endonuclease
VNLVAAPAHLRLISVSKNGKCNVTRTTTKQMRTLTSLRRTYDYQMRERASFAGQRAPLHDRRRRLHNEQRYRDGDAELLYRGPLVVCLRHRGRVAPRECVVRRTIRRYWPGAPIPYEVWEPAASVAAGEPEPVPAEIVSMSVTTTSTSARGGGTAEPTSASTAATSATGIRYLDDEARSLPLLDAVEGVPVPQIEVLNGSTATVTLANDDALAFGSAGTCDGCVPALYHRFTVLAALPQDEANEWCVYVLRSDTADADANGYVGVTPFVDRRGRLAAYNGKAQHGASATVSGRPWRMVCALRGLATRQAAETIEAQIHHLLPDNGPLGPFQSCLNALEAHASAGKVSKQRVSLPNPNTLAPKPNILRHPNKWEPCLRVAARCGGAWVWSLNALFGHFHVDGVGAKGLCVCWCFRLRA